MATTANHLDNISITILLAAPPQDDAKFVTALFLRDGITLGGDRVRTYTSLAAVQADADAGNVDTVTVQVATKVFAQVPAPRQWKVGRYDATGGESLSDGLNAVLAVDCAFYYVTCDSRVAVAQVALAETIRTLGLGNTKLLGLYQSSDADWLTAGVPAGYASLVSNSNERAFILYHSNDAEWNAEGWAGALSARDPRVLSFPFDLEVKDGDATSPPTQVQKDAIDANFANIGLEYPPNAAYFVDSGVNVLGRAGHEIVSIDWFYTELQQNVATAKVRRSNRGQKWPIDQEGAELLSAEVASLNQEGVDKQHFQLGQTLATTITPTDADRANRRLRASGSAALLDSATRFEFTIEATRNPIFTEA